MAPIRTIVHPTDFSAASAATFAQALRGALIEESTLFLLRVAATGDESDWSGLPHVREPLARRGLLDALHGSTSERVLRQAPCPLLTAPAFI